MADSFVSLADVVKLNDMNLADIDVTDLLDDAPFLKALFAMTSSNGTDHKYLKETGAPVVGFRAVNDGTENSKSSDTLVTINLKILAASFAIDKALAESYGKGGAPALIQKEAVRHLKAAFFMAEKQLINGTDNDADGFTGLVDASTIDALADAMVVNAGGTTADVQSSVYLVRTNGENDVAAVMGNDGNISIDETTVIRGDGSATGTLPMYYTPIEGWLGLQVGSAQSIGRIVNLSATDSKTLTDDLIYAGISKFPAGRKPNLIVMNGTRREELRKSRTATNATGAPAPVPETVGNARIIETDAILNTEALVA